MFHLIKSELKYSKFGLIHTNWIFLGFLVYAYIREFNPLNILCFLFFIFYLSYIFVNDTKESRDQAIRLLPLSSRQTAKVRIILILIGFITIYFGGTFVYILFNFQAVGFRDSIYELFMLGGIALLAAFTYLFLSDVFSIFTSKSSYKWFNLFVGIFIGLSVIFTAAFIRNIYLTSNDSAVISIIALYILSIVLAYISKITFYQKESHLGYK